MVVRAMSHAAIGGHVGGKELNIYAFRCVDTSRTQCDLSEQANPRTLWISYRLTGCQSVRTSR
jgi:hypothetical protein